MNGYPKESWKLSPKEVAPHFMKMFFRVSTATAGLPTRKDKAYRYVEVFFWKFVDHFNSCFFLANGTPVLGRKQIFYDSSSINVIIRACWETYLSFNHIYVKSETKEERDFRFLGWWLAGLLDRQEAPRFDANSVLKLAMEKADIMRIRMQLQGNPYFDKWTAKQRKALLAHVQHSAR
jgi:hypothetical protein